MTAACYSSAITVIPKRFCGLRVLLVEPDKTSLQHHADVLQHNSYRVTTTTEASNGLSMMMNGHTYDCVLIDADMYETDMKAFLHQVLRHQPQMSIILMASDDIHLRIPKEALENEAVLCLLKPCCYRDICDIWKHICRNRISFEENDASKEKVLKEDQVRNKVPRVTPRVNPTTINDSAAINNNMSKKVTYEDLFSDDDDDDDNDQEDVNEITTKEKIDIGKIKKADEGKQPLILKKKNDQPVEDDKYPKKRKEIKTRVTWKGELDDKFKKALKELGKQAHSSAILKHMNVPGLTRYHVASHLQKYQKKQKSIEASIAALAQRGNNLQVESFANIKRPDSTQSNDDASIIQSSSSLLRSSKHNLAGISYMIIENIRAKLQEAPQLHAPNYGDDQVTDHSFGVVEHSNSGGQGTETQLTVHDNGIAIVPQVTDEILSHDHTFGEAMAPLGFDETVASDYDLAIDVNCLLSDLDIENFGDAGSSGLGEVQEQLACFVPATEPCAAGCGRVSALLNHEDFHVNRENLYPVSPHSSTLFDVENCINHGSSLDSILFGPASAEFSMPEFQTNEKGSLAHNHIQLPVNSIFPFDGSEGRFIDNELSQSDYQHTIGVFNDDDDYGNLVHGQWYF